MPWAAARGGETCGGGLHMIDIHDPKQPKFAGCFADPTTGRAGTGLHRTTRSAWCTTAPMRATAATRSASTPTETALSIADVTDKKNPVALAPCAYPERGLRTPGLAHRRPQYFYLDDEGDELAGEAPRAPARSSGTWQTSTTRCWAGSMSARTKAIDHNLYVKGDSMYQSNYMSGPAHPRHQRPAQPEEVGLLRHRPGRRRAGVRRLVEQLSVLQERGDRGHQHERRGVHAAEAPDVHGSVNR